MRYLVVGSSVVLLCGILLVAGCGPAGTSSNSSAAPDAAAGEEKAIHEAMAELEPADRAAAIKQGVCPVSGEKLGGMGKPFKTTVKGRTVFLCCEGCVDELNKEPDKYLAKLPK